jgi:hypothetical protein
MWYHRKRSQKVKAFRLPTQPDETIDHRLTLMLNEPVINEQWETTNEETIKIKTEIGFQFATWGDWIISDDGRLFTMSNESFLSLFEISIYPETLRFGKHFCRKINYGVDMAE